MNFHLLYGPSFPVGISLYPDVDKQSGEISFLNEFLDALWTRGLSLCSVRAYAYDQLDFARWWFPHPPPPFAEIDFAAGATADCTACLEQAPQP